MDFDKIFLSHGEKLSLRSFYWKKKQTRNEIKHFQSLYNDYQFIKINYSKEQDTFNQFVPDGTYSLSERYERFKIYRREKMLYNIPNWFTVLIALLSLIVSVLTLLFQQGLL